MIASVEGIASFQAQVSITSGAAFFLEVLVPFFAYNTSSILYPNRERAIHTPWFWRKRQLDRHHSAWEYVVRLPLRTTAGGKYISRWGSRLRNLGHLHESRDHEIWIPPLSGGQSILNPRASRSRCRVENRSALQGNERSALEVFGSQGQAYLRRPRYISKVAGFSIDSYESATDSTPSELRVSDDPRAVQH